MTAEYKSPDLTFPYPENWKVTQEDRNSWPRTVTVESPSGAFFSVHLYPISSKLLDLTDEALASMKAEYDSLESEAIEDSIGGVAIRGYDMHFYVLDFVVAAGIRGARTVRGPMVVLWQAESREHEQLSLVFQALLTGLLKELTPLPGFS